MVCLLWALEVETKEREVGPESGAGSSAIANWQLRNQSHICIVVGLPSEVVEMAEKVLMAYELHHLEATSLPSGHRMKCTDR